jgi:Isochorismatase family
MTTNRPSVPTQPPVHYKTLQALIVQNGNAYDEGLREFWDPIKRYWNDPTLENREALRVLVDPKSTRWQYENGVADRTLLDPTTWTLDQVGLDRPGSADIEDGKTIVVAPHRVWGPETNDLVLQLRKRKVSKVLLGGMLANMCVDSHLRELLEQGFEVAVAKDATAAPKHPDPPVGCPGTRSGDRRFELGPGRIAYRILSQLSPELFLSSGKWSG